MDKKLFFDFNKQSISFNFSEEIKKSINVKNRFILLLITRDTCNLNCKYCFLDRNMGRVINDATLRKIIIEFMTFFKYKDDCMLEFLFHGPEITQDILQIEKAIQFQKEYYKKLKISKPLYYTDCQKGEIPFISNTIQTNGTLINERLINVLEVGAFKSIGISLDGPKEIHDANRTYINGRGSFDDIMKSIEYAKIKKIPIAAISVFTKQSKNKINEIYNFFKEHNISFRFNPVVSSKKSQYFVITPAEYADAMIELVDIYLSDPDDLIKIINIDQYIQIIYSNMLRILHNKKLISLDFYDFSDIFSLSCQGFMCSIAPDGSIYPCESLMNYDKFIYGNIYDGIEKIFFSNKRINFINRVNKINECYNCELFNICFGGCPSNAYKINRDINSKDPFCEAYLRIFRYIKNKIYNV